MVVIGQVRKPSESSDPHTGSIGKSLRRLVAIAATASLGVTTAPTNSSPKNQEDVSILNRYSLAASELPQGFLANLGRGDLRNSDESLQETLIAQRNFVPAAASAACEAPFPGPAVFSEPGALNVQFEAHSEGGKPSSLRTYVLVESNSDPSPVGALAFAGGSAAVLLRRR